MAVYARTAIPSATWLTHIIDPHLNFVLSILDQLRYVDVEWCIAVAMSACQLSVDIYLTILIDTIKMKFQSIALFQYGCGERLFVATISRGIISPIIACRSISFRGMVDVPVVRQVNLLPVPLVFRELPKSKFCLMLCV